MVRTSHARSALAASFERFFLEAARTAYPEGGFSDLGAAFAASTDL